MTSASPVAMSLLAMRESTFPLPPKTARRRLLVTKKKTYVETIANSIFRTDQSQQHREADDRRAHLPHLGPSYGMDFDRHDYANPYLPPLPMNNGGGGSGMNDISALAAAASDQLYELERHEAFRRAEYELRHRQIAAGAGRSKSNGGSPGASSGGGAYGFSNERDRFTQGAPSTPNGGQVVFPVSAPQPPTANHPAVPAGTLADPTYLLPPTCCHEDCHKSYRKRLKVARQTAACPNCLTPAHHAGGHGGHSAGGAGHGPASGGGNDHSSNSSTPKERSNLGSSEDLTKLSGNGPSGSNYHLHHANLQQQLARLQQQHTMSLQKGGGSGGSSSRSSHHPKPHHHINPYPVNMHSHRSTHASLAPSADVSRAASPESDDSSDDEMHPGHRSVELPHGSPVLAGMRGMTLFGARNAATAPVSMNASPVTSRAPSPIEGHSASSGKHGHASHTARDAKNRSHPYGHPHHHHHHHHPHSHGSVPNSPLVSATKSRMSPPKLPEPHKSVEEILNSSAIPPPPPPSDRTLPPPHTSASFSSVPSVSYSLSVGSAHGSPVGSRASSPVHTTSSSSQHSQLAHSVRAAFGMTPMFRGSETPSTVTTNPSPKSVLGGHSTSPPPKLAPLSGGAQSDVKPSLPSFSRGPSPVHLMELDGQA